MVIGRRKQFRAAELLWGGLVMLAALVAGWLSSRFTLLSALAVAAGVGSLLAFAWSITLTQRRLVITLLVSSILLPGIPVPGLLQIRPEELIVLALMPAILSHMRGRWNRIDLCFGLLGISTLVSIAWGTWVQGVPFSPRDFMELVKLVKFWVFFRLALYRWTEQDLRSITLWLLGSMGLSALVGIVQWQNWMGIGTLTKTLYGQGSVHVGKARTIGTMVSPIYFSLLMVAGLAFIVSGLQWHRRRSVILVLGGLCLVVVVLTGSRSGTLAAGMVLLVTAGLRIMWLRRIALRRWLAWIVAALIVVAVARLTAGRWLSGELESLKHMNAVEKLSYSRQSPLHHLVFRFDALEGGREARVAIWQENLEIFSESPLFGWGPAKSVQGTVTDNGYVLSLRRYGLVGLVFFLLLYWQVLRFCWKLLRLYPYQSVTWATALSIVAVTLAYLVANMSVETFYQLQLMSFFWLIAGIGYSMLYFRTEVQRGAPHNLVG